MDHYKLLHSEFEQHALNTPLAVALTHENQVLSYQDLNHAANQLAHYLIEQGIRSESIVGVCFNTCFEQIISVLAVLKIGAAYLPLDPNYPSQRLNYILDNAGAIALLTNTTTSGLRINYTKIILVDALANLALYSTQAPKIKLSDSMLSYVIYTSGSTGQPKGVMIEHRNAYNTVNQMQGIFSLLPKDKVLLNVSLGFDPSVWMIFWPLSLGSSVILSVIEKDPESICQKIIDNKLRVFHAGPTLFRMLATYSKFSSCKSLEMIIGGGEAWKLTDLELLKQQLPSCELCNVYGPTEASIHATYWHSKNNSITDLQEIPIGKPLKQIKTLILDDQLNELSDGQLGELYLSGLGIGRGYLNQPKLTQEKFIFIDRYKQYGRLYKTGDLASQQKDGNLFFHGRVDDQIKLRGFRIEPREIENHILKSGMAKNVVVLGHKIDGIIDKLIGFIVLGTTQEQDYEIKIKTYLKSQIPEFMIPNYFIVVDKLPITVHEKIDKDALLQLLDIKKEVCYSQLNNVNTFSITDVLKILWLDILKIKMIDFKDNFFDLGGDSLTALDFTARINDQLNLNLSVACLFNYPTIESYSNYLIQEKIIAEPYYLLTDKKVDNLENNWPLSDNQLWLIRMAKGSSYINNIIMPFKIMSDINSTLMSQSVADLINQHDILRAHIILKENTGEMVLRSVMPSVFNEIDLSLLSESEQLNELHNQYDKLNNSSIDLSFDLLFKVTLFKCSKSMSYIYIYMHHLISDPFSGIFIFQKLIKDYQARLNNVIPIIDQPISFSSYISHEKQQKNTHEYQNNAVQWKEMLIDKNCFINFGNISETDLNAGFIESPISNFFIKKIRHSAKKFHVTPFIFLLSVLKLSLYKLYHQELFGIGINISRRDNAKWSQMIGPLSEQAISLINFSEVKNFSDVVKTTEKNLNTIYQSPVTIESIYQKISLEKNNETDLFNVLFDYEKNEEVKTIDNIRFELLPIRSANLVRRHLSFRVSDNGKEMFIKIRYRHKLFTEQAIHLLIEKYMDTISSIAESISSVEFNVA